MFRTRDFILYFSAIVFLLVAIGFALVDDNVVPRTNQTLFGSEQTEISNVSANVASTNDTSLSRDERLSALREKIKDSELVTLSEPSSEEEPKIVFDVEAVADEILSEPLLCAGYNPLSIIDWPVGEIQMIHTEGVRQYFTEQNVRVGTSSSSTVEKVVFLTLPTKFVPFGGSNCLASDIIGVALDGSLIRNNETRLYSIFGRETIIGYALDGYPIYGLGSAAADECGGRIVLGQYRYELSDSRSTIINCFADAPQHFVK